MPKDDQLVELTIERIGAAGDGVAHWRGEHIYLPFTAPGDRVRARLGMRRGGGREGRVAALITAGPGRVQPPCRHFGRCGGCALQHLGAEAYRAAKLDALQAALGRVGIAAGAVAALRTVAPARRRARLGLRGPNPRAAAASIGFRQRFGHEIVDLHECLVLEPPLFALAGALRDLAAEILPPGGAGEAMLTRTDSGIDLLFEAAGRPGLAALEALAAFAADRDLARVVWRSPSDEFPVVERRPVRVLRSGIAVAFPPGAFLQASAAAEAILITEALAGVGGRRPVLDLYSGLGGFAFALAEAGPVHAVEGDKRAAEALAEAARRRPGITVERRDLARDPMPPELLAGYAAAVFDPPRAGAAAQAEALARSSLDTVVAVSCNPASFARDAARLIAGGFDLERLVAVDQFAWTPHLELVAVFRR